MRLRVFLWASRGAIPGGCQRAREAFGSGPGARRGSSDRTQCDGAAQHIYFLAKDIYAHCDAVPPRRGK